MTRTPSRGQRKNIRILHGTGSMPCCATVDLGNLLCRQPESAVLLGGKAKPVLLHRCQNAEISLYSTGIVVSNHRTAHLTKFLVSHRPLLCFLRRTDMPLPPPTFDWNYTSAQLYEAEVLLAPPHDRYGATFETAQSLPPLSVLPDAGLILRASNFLLRIFFLLCLSLLS